MVTSSKGKRVKQSKYHIPQLDQSHIEEVIHVYFKADEGSFYIYVPEHIAKVVHEVKMDYDSDGAIYRHDNATVRAATMNVCIKGFEKVLGAFKDILKHEQRKKVIRVTFKYNISTMPDGSFRGYNPGNDIGFAGRPALHVMHEVLWQSANRLYEQKRPQDQLRDVGPAINRVGRSNYHEGRYLIDWTEEREAFFDSMKSSLEHLIHLLILFTRELEQDPDAAIQSLTGGMTLLPPPKQHAEE